MTRLLIAASVVVLLVTVACSGGDSPTSPSGSGAATITGTVVAARNPTTNVSVAGTSIASAIDGSGSFALGGVPTGDVELLFSGSGPTSTLSVASVKDR